jgi:2-C-methyl-D-erythritol 4-phosphate cytidylyltransferase/2-C-methyl-D-erythritol 2,4-cyclodiphosphate synthase
VVLHAWTDALLGACGEGDIGQHFPPSDPQWKNASSDQFVLHAMSLLRARGGAVVNADVTILCEAPKVGPHRDAMRAKIAELLEIDATRVNIKATTTEKLGALGRGEGLAAECVVLVKLSA